jgi:hypothetical protein
VALSKAIRQVTRFIDDSHRDEPGVFEISDGGRCRLRKAPRLTVEIGHGHAPPAAESTPLSTSLSSSISEGRL